MRSKNDGGSGGAGWGVERMEMSEEAVRKKSERRRELRAHVWFVLIMSIHLVHLVAAKRYTYLQLSVHAEYVEEASNAVLQYCHIIFIVVRVVLVVVVLRVHLDSP